MGTYSQPLIIEDALGLKAMHTANAGFISATNDMFEKIRKETLERAKINQKNIKKSQSQAAKIGKKFEKDITKNKLTSSYDGQQNVDILRNVKDSYLIPAIQKQMDGISTSEEDANIEFINGLPTMLGELDGILAGIQEEYDASYLLPPGSENSINILKSPPTVIAFANDRATQGTNYSPNQRLEIDIENQQAYYVLRDQDEFEEAYKNWETQASSRQGFDTWDDNKKMKLFQVEVDEKDRGINRLNIGETVLKYKSGKGKGALIRNKDIRKMSLGGYTKEGQANIRKEAIDGIVSDLLKTRAFIPTEQDTQSDAQKDENNQKFNTQLAQRISVGIDNGAFLNRFTDLELGPATIWQGAVDKNIQTLDNLTLDLQSGSLEINELNALEEDLLSFWYGDNWDDNIQNMNADAGDPISMYKENNMGAANFGDYDPTENPDEARIVDMAMKFYLYEDRARNFITPDYIVKRSSSGGRGRGSASADRMQKVKRYTNKIADKYIYFDNSTKSKQFSSPQAKTRIYEVLKDKNKDGKQHYYTIDEIKAGPPGWAKPSPKIIQFLDGLSNDGTDIIKIDERASGPDNQYKLVTPDKFREYFVETSYGYKGDKAIDFQDTTP
jgi:hypothetical protein